MQIFFTETQQTKSNCFVHTVKKPVHMIINNVSLIFGNVSSSSLTYCFVRGIPLEKKSVKLKCWDFLCLMITLIILAPCLNIFHHGIWLHIRVTFWSASNQTEHSSNMDQTLHYCTAGIIRGGFIFAIFTFL